jgi:hypothetical protein
MFLTWRSDTDNTQKLRNCDKIMVRLNLVRLTALQHHTFSKSKTYRLVNKIKPLEIRSSLINRPRVLR